MKTRQGGATIGSAAKPSGCISLFAIRSSTFCKKGCAACARRDGACGAVVVRVTGGWFVTRKGGVGEAQLAFSRRRDRMVHPCRRANSNRVVACFFVVDLACVRTNKSSRQALQD